MISGAKLRLKDFLNTTPIGNNYTFEMPGNQLQAENHVQNMRVHLSRVKKKYKVNKRPFNEFKICIIEIVPVRLKEKVGPNEVEIDGCKVTIQRANPGNLDQQFQDFHL